MSQDAPPTLVELGQFLDQLPKHQGLREIRPTEMFYEALVSVFYSISK
jgi:hypothetical protein